MYYLCNCLLHMILAFTGLSPWHWLTHKGKPIDIQTESKIITFKTGGYFRGETTFCITPNLHKTSKYFIHICLNFCTKLFQRLENINFHLILQHFALG